MPTRETGTNTISHFFVCFISCQQPLAQALLSVYINFTSTVACFWVSGLLAQGPLAVRGPRALALIDPSHNLSLDTHVWGWFTWVCVCVYVCACTAGRLCVPATLDGAIFFFLLALQRTFSLLVKIICSVMDISWHIPFLAVWLSRLM